MDDSSVMRFGRYKGRQLADVPAGYLMYLYDEKIARGELLQYIRDNMTVLRAQIERELKYGKPVKVR